MQIKDCKFYSLAALAAVMVLTGCASRKCEAPDPEMTFTRVSAPIKVDGVLDDAAWAKAPGVDFILCSPVRLPREAQRVSQDKFEPGTVKFMYDDKNLYIGCRMTDSDLAAFLDEDQGDLNRYGDMFGFALTVRRKGAPYWAFGVAPNGRMLSYCYPSTGAAFPHVSKMGKLMPGLKAAVKRDGTLNNHDDKDRGWSLEMVIPIAQLEKSGVKFNSSEPWAAAVSRFNNSRYLYARQDSTFPALQKVSVMDFVQYFSPVVFR